MLCIVLRLSGRHTQCMESPALITLPSQCQCQPTGQALSSSSPGPFQVYSIIWIVKIDSENILFQSCVMNHSITPQPNKSTTILNKFTRINIDVPSCSYIIISTITFFVSIFCYELLSVLVSSTGRNHSCSVIFFIFGI